jgi:hypothetical protein
LRAQIVVAAYIFQYMAQRILVDKGVVPQSASGLQQGRVRPRQVVEALLAIRAVIEVEDQLSLLVRGEGRLTGWWRFGQ